MKWYDRKYRHEITKCMARQRRWRQAAHSMVPSTNKDLPTQCFWQIRLDVIHQVLGLLVHVLSDPFRAWFLILNNWFTKKKKWRQLSQRRLWSCLGIHYKITFEPKIILPTIMTLTFTFSFLLYVEFTLHSRHIFNLIPALDCVTPLLDSIFPFWCKSSFVFFESERSNFWLHLITLCLSKAFWRYLISLITH